MILATHKPITSTTTNITHKRYIPYILSMLSPKKTLAFLPIMLTLILTCLVCSGCKQDRLDIIKRNDRVNIGILGPFPPFSSINEQGSPEGLAVLLAQRIAKDLLGSEDKATFIMLSPDENINALIKNRVDVVVGMICGAKDLRDEKSEKIECARAYFNTHISIIGIDSANLGFQSLYNAPLILQKGSIIDSYFKKHYPTLSYIYCANTDECFSLLAQNDRANLALYDIVARHFIRQNPQFRFSINKLGVPHIIAPAVKKGNKKLLEWLDNEITLLTNEGFFAQSQAYLLH